MKRRAFLQKSLTLAAAYHHVSPLLGKGQLTESQQRSRVVVSRQKPEGASYSSDDIAKNLDNSMMALFDSDDPLSPWKKIIRPHEVIGLKVNCLSGLGSTHPDLVEVIGQRLQQSGVKAENIIIWDRFNRDLEDGKFNINESGNGVRCFGNDTPGFEYNLEQFGSSASRLTKIVTQHCAAIINLPLLKDHSIAGLTMAMKNMFGAIHNPNKYHLNVGDPYIADINAFPTLRSKIRLHICDAMEAQYEGGPSFMPHWRWNFNGLIVSTDPVAMDFTGWQIIDHKRTTMGLETLEQSGRKPTYIKTAADAKHRLGRFGQDQIELIYV